MRLELEVLDGDHKGKRISLKNGLQLGRQQGYGQEAFAFTDSEMAELHAVIALDSKKQWNIECLAPSRMRLGFEEVDRATLIQGLVFHLGQTGFKVVEHVRSLKGTNWVEDFKDWLENNPARQTSTEIFFFLHPVRLSFTQGPQYEDVYTLSYGPRELGYNSLDLNLKDPASPPRVARFFQIGDKAYIENLCGDKATINGQPFDQHVINNGDFLRVSSSTIELSILI
ncbi:hypothetical protein [Pseudobdellovibrio exovorus]|uniref:FHA domain-containing protein n=1 Tax=Pseudobdellovibrio exovorus JSS TaxID=1184267 RepID=M4VME1_9BACT|nr:hypothetical protein [Pseudobdellovibrio exovorus]AGH94249.1 hypothetical protein A11Q_29 [Pseudobdellovibrio exovorus JSS]